MDWFVQWFMPNLTKNPQSIKLSRRGAMVRRESDRAAALAVKYDWTYFYCGWKMPWAGDWLHRAFRYQSSHDMTRTVSRGVK